MMILRLFLTAGAALLLHPALAQSRTDKVADEILRDGLALYQSERASWVATDVLMAQKPNMEQLLGYVSYADGDSVRTVFFGRTAATEPLGVYYAFAFPKQQIAPTTIRQSHARHATTQEEQLFAALQTVRAELRTGARLGQPYGFPANTSPNIVLLPGQPLRAYILTGPREPVLPIGNDFLLTLNTAGDEVKTVERLHNSYLPMRLEAGQESVKAGMHSHLPAHPYITPTDICSLLLYEQAFPAGQHYVIGEDYVSLFDVPKRQLVILTRKAWDRINSHRNFKE